MKRFIYIVLGLAFIFGVSSCDDYLDVNTDPDNPTSATASVSVRLPWIQNYYAYAYGTAGMRVNTVAGLLTQTTGTAANSKLAAWSPDRLSCTTIYQNWYVGAAVNIPPLLEKGAETEANHYIGAAYCVNAMGFMMMLDLHGEIPIKEAFTGKTDPAYEDGKELFYICMDYLDKAIEHLSLPQGSGSPALSEGDLWNNGDTDKWIKLCHALKARYLLKLSKKSDLYDPDAILAEVEKGPKANRDNTIMKHYNVDGDENHFTVADPYQTNVYWNTVSYGTSQRFTRYYMNMLTNNFTGGSGVTDPRLPKLVPAIMSNVQLNESGAIQSYEWKRDVGVDMMYSNIRQVGGPILTVFATSADIKREYPIEDPTERAKFVADAKLLHEEVTVTGETVSITYKKGSAYCASTDYKRAGDTIYVSTRSNSFATAGRSATDMYYYPAAGYNYVAGTGNFYSRPDSDTDYMTYSEMCFIKAEVYFRKGEKGQALAAYKEGIQAHFDRMQTKLEEWTAAGTINPDQMPMDDADIATYMASAAVCQNEAQLTMAEIIRQKTIAMGFDPEIWNDMRRFNYSAGNIGTFGNVYPDFKRPQEFTGTSYIPGSNPTDLTYWFRRFDQSSHEHNYNLTQLKASNKMAALNSIWSCPVWWDCETDSEYYGYIGSK